MPHHTQEQSALDTLAEVSRQRLDTSPHNQPGQDIHIEQSASNVEQPHEEDQFYAQLRDAVTAAPAQSVGEHSQHSVEQSSRLPPSSAIHGPAPLVETASAANEQLEQSSGQENLDPALEDHDAHTREALTSYNSPEGDILNATQRDDRTKGPGSIIPHGLPISESSDPNLAVSHGLPLIEDHEPMSWVSTNGPIEAHPSSHSLRNIMAAAKKPISFNSNEGLAVTHTFPTSLSDVMAASNQPISGFGPLRNNTKVRSKFTDNRRKEVQEIRKRGACIRCRMLKKPCSEGTPCNTCKTVGSARLWKGACLRTRLADEFTLWSVGIFASRAQTTMDDAAQGLEKESVEASLEVCLLPESDSHIVLPARRYNQNNLAKQRNAMNAYSGEDPDLVLRAHFEAHNDSPPVYLLADEAVVSTKLEEYATRLAHDYIEHEASPFLKATLHRAQNMILKEENESTPVPSNGSVRASYTFQNQLLRHVVELWVSTTILTRTTDMGICFRVPTQEEHIDLLPENIPLLQCQLLANLESRCVALSKSILNELERRLLQRQQVSRFGTFLSSVILLNCVERMTELFHSTEQNEENTDTPPLSSQGSHFADLLIMLLRMRGLPPKTRADSQGRLVVVKPSAVSSSAVQVSASKKLEYDALEVAAEWLDTLGLEYEEVIRARDQNDGNEGSWDMKFISRALLPPDGGK